MTYLLLAFFTTLHCLVSLSSAENCSTLDGTWYNQLGSMMVLTHRDDGEIVGEYRTAVERKNGTSGGKHSIIIGAAPYNSPGSTFGMAVLWNNGTSATSWSGQCQVCADGRETLVTSWLLREKVDSCIDKWKSTRIGRDFFTRSEQTWQSNTFTYAENTYNQREKRETGNESIRRCTLSGFWYNLLGSEVMLQYRGDNYITGEYRTAVERRRGSAGNTHSKVYGIGNPNDPDSTFALFVVWNKGESVTGWVGQCHVCGESKTEVVEAAWLLRSKVPTCHDAWRSTLYGESSFTREEQRQGPRRRDDTHTPTEVGEVGEDDGTLERALSCPSHAADSVQHIACFILSLLIMLLPVV